MKKNAVLSLVLCLFLFAGCSDDDENSEEKGISKEYTGRYLALKLNESDFYEGAVDLITTDLTKGNFALKYLFPAERNIIVSSVPLTQDENDKGVYHFTGESKNPHREITFTGTADGENMVMDTKFKVVSAVAKTWTPGGEVPLSLRITPSSEDATMNMYGLLEYQEVLVTFGCEILSSFVSIMFSLVIDLEFDLKDDGNLIVGWDGKLLGTGLIPEGQLEEGMVKYNVTDGQIYVTVNLENLLPDLINGGLPAEINLEELLELFRGIVQGIPVNYGFNDAGNLELTFTKEVLTPYLKVLMPLLIGVLADIDIPDIFSEIFTKEGLLQLLPELMRVIEESQDFNIVLTIG